MRHRHDGRVFDDSGRGYAVSTGYEPSIWQCDWCGHPNEFSPHDDWPTCVFCGRFRDDDVDCTYGWYEGDE